MIPELVTRQSDAKCIIAHLKQLLNLDLENTLTTFGTLADEVKLEIMLVEMESKEFESMEKCLNMLETYVPNTVKDVWELYKQFLNTDFDTILCFCCKIRRYVDIKHCSRYLHRYGIISGHLHKTILYKNAEVGSQDALWNELEAECDKYHTSKHIVEAVNYGLHAHTHQYGFLLAEADRWLNQKCSTFKCKCQEACSEIFMPKRYTLKAPSSSIFMDKFDKENLVPTSTQTESAHYQKKGCKPKTGSNKHFETRQIQAKYPKNETRKGDVAVSKDLGAFNKVDFEEVQNEDETNLKQLFHQNKRETDHSTKPDHSTNIYNFYNKGSVSFGTNVAQMKCNTQTEGLISDQNTLPERRIAFPVSETEPAPQRLTHAQPQLPAITYPRKTEESDDNEYSSTSPFDLQIEQNSNRDEISNKRDRCKSETVQSEVRRSGPFNMENKHVCSERKTGRGLLRRQLSAPYSY